MFKKYMKVGNVLICLNCDFYTGYTKNKQYIIYKIDTIHNELYGFIKDDFGNETYFKASEAINNNWVYLHIIRRIKLEKINKIPNKLESL